MVILGFPVWFLTLMKRSLCFHYRLRELLSILLNNHSIPTCAVNIQWPSSNDHQDHNCSGMSWVYYLLNGGRTHTMGNHQASLPGSNLTEKGMLFFPGDERWGWVQMLEGWSSSTQQGFPQGDKADNREKLCPAFHFKWLLMCNCPLS